MSENPYEPPTSNKMAPAKLSWPFWRMLLFVTLACGAYGVGMTVFRSANDALAIVIVLMMFVLLEMLLFATIDRLTGCGGND